MSIRGSSATPFSAALLLSTLAFVAWNALGLPLSTAATSQPAVTVVKATTTAPAETGVVRKALKRLVTIPRPGTELPDETVRPSKASPAPVVPQGKTSGAAPAVKPVQRAILRAGQNSEQQPQTEQPPADQPQPAPEASYVYPVPAPYVYVPPPYVQMPLNEMSPADREWNSYLSFGGRPWGYGYGYGYGPYYGGYSYYPGESWGDAYRFGFTSGYNYWRFHKTSTERQESVAVHALNAMDRGLKFYREGKYRQAIDAFKLAAETDQGDPAARIYAAHALFATGRYREAMPFLARAFELQPKLALLDYDMRGDYGRPADFEAQVRALESALAQSPSSVERLIMLGYVRFYSGQKDAAYDPLSKAKILDPANALPDRLLPHCTPPDVVLDSQKTAAKPATTR
ncbi:MAG TPA: tetratricopeptide repeat protein [Phycisphaerae bacterium]|nr:tetratricopeptide repeat protein [Phycisphaerae bacterium]HRR84519.1 tetratricopeptide repeat protein [Phycisphaerae bacterium]